MEERIRLDVVPKEAKDQVKNLFGKVKSLKWYKETSLEKISYEAKFKFNRHFYSVEFDTLGTLEDIEIEIKQDELSETTLQNLENYLSQNFEEHTVSKIQRQLTGDISGLKKYLKGDQNAEITIKYEIIVSGKSEDWNAWEMLFDKDGNFISKEKVIMKWSDNLIF